MGSRSLKNRAGIKKKHPIIGVLIVLTVIFSIIMACCVSAYALCASWISDIEDYPIEELANYNTAEPTEVYASDGTTLLAKFQLENRDPLTSLDDISEYVIAGTVATEDERFYEHDGIDLLSIARAIVVNLTGSGSEGASTITQQLVRNTILADEMTDITIERKIREAYLALKVEETFTKDEILLMYLNTINYGNGTYGIQAAAQLYFSKDASDLTLEEAAALVGIPNSPTYYEPINYPENCESRRNTVLSRMLSTEDITQEEYDEAVEAELVLDISETTNDGIYAYPYFTSYVRNTLLESYSTAEIFQGGLKVITTLDLDTQAAAEDAVATKEATMDSAIEGALVAIDPDNGFVVALVGGKDYYEDETNLATGQGTDGGRPCGSTFKMFTLVAALEAGISPDTLINCDSPAVIPNTAYTSDNMLSNISNVDYGTRSIQSAFAVSSNTGFVRLQMSLGTDTVIDVAEKMGITSDLEPYDSLTLGQQNVTMLDMAAAYATVANGGTYYEPQPIYQVYNSDGELIVDNSTPLGNRVISAEVAYAATEVMKTVVTTSEGTGNAAALSNGQEVAAKTGTSSSYYDLTFCGITPQLSVAIWFGDPSNTVTLEGSSNLASVFSDFMNQVLEGEPLEYFPVASIPTYISYIDDIYDIGLVVVEEEEVEEEEEEEVEEDTEEDTEEDSSSSDSSSSDSSSSGSSSGDSSSSGSSGDSSGGDSSSGGDTSGGDTSGGDTSGGDTSGGDTSGGDTSTGGSDTSTISET